MQDVGEGGLHSAGGEQLSECARCCCELGVPGNRIYPAITTKTIGAKALNGNLTRMAAQGQELD